MMNDEDGDKQVIAYLVACGEDLVYPGLTAYITSLAFWVLSFAHTIKGILENA